MNSQSMNVENAVKLAHARLRAGDQAEAEAIYREVLAVDHGHFDALHGLGVIAMSAGKFDRAAELIGSALQANPFNCDAHHNLGISLMQQGKIHEAIQSFNRAISLKQDYRSAMYNLARAHQELGNHGAGLELMLKAIGSVRFTLNKVMLISTVQEERNRDDPSPKAA